MPVSMVLTCWPVVEAAKVELLMPNTVMSAMAMVKIVVFIVLIFFSCECLFVFNVQSNGLFGVLKNEIDRGTAIIDEGCLLDNKRQIVDLQDVFEPFIAQKQGFVGYILAIVDIKPCFAGKKRLKASTFLLFLPHKFSFNIPLY